MITDLDETIRRLLTDELAVQNGRIDISFDQPKREWSARLNNRPTVNLYLYDVRENPTLRQHQWETLGNSQYGEHLAQLKRTLLRIDCFYLLTTWASNPEDEHHLLTLCLLALARHPLLPEERLIGSLRAPSYELQTRLARHDMLTNPAELWGALDNEMRPSIPYVVTLTLDPWSTIPVPLVLTAELRFGQAENLPDQKQLRPETIEEGLWFVGGAVRSQQSLESVRLTLVERGLAIPVRPDGRYVIGRLQKGEYTLEISASEGVSIRQPLHVPSQSYDIDLSEAGMEVARPTRNRKGRKG